MVLLKQEDEAVAEEAQKNTAVAAVLAAGE